VQKAIFLLSLYFPAFTAVLQHIHHLTITKHCLKPLLSSISGHWGRPLPKMAHKTCTTLAQNLHALAITCAQIVHAIKISLHELCTLTPQIVHDICTSHTHQSTAFA
jgi:hypothetical protein